MQAALIAVERSLRGEFVLVEEAAEPVAPADATLAVVRRDGNQLEKRGPLLERAVRAMVLSWATYSRSTRLEQRGHRLDEVRNRRDKENPNLPLQTHPYV